jgi:hypothetical protein
MLSSNSLKEMLKRTPKKSYRPETFAYSKKSKKLHFSVAVYCNFFNGLVITILYHSAFFYNHIAFFKTMIILALFANFEVKCGRNGH